MRDSGMRLIEMLCLWQWYKKYILSTHTRIQCKAFCNLSTQIRAGHGISLLASSAPVWKIRKWIWNWVNRWQLKMNHLRMSALNVARMSLLWRISIVVFSFSIQPAPEFSTYTLNIWAFESGTIYLIGIWRRAAFTQSILINSRNQLFG